MDFPRVETYSVLFLYLEFVSGVEALFFLQHLSS